jgi:pimeloyl-ACP methyl ester carboxylesterase
LSAVQCPTLIVSGERSPAPARRSADLLAGRIAQARRVTLAGVGHMAPVSQPELTAECIQAALRKDYPTARQQQWQLAAV